MDTLSISELRGYRDRLQRSRRTLRATQHSGEKYGDEQEYTAQGIVAGLASILTDVSALIRAPAKFIQKSTHAERVQLTRSLARLEAGIEQKNFHELAASIDEIKPLIRSLNVRYTDERMEAFDEQINDVQRSASDLSQKIIEVETIEAEVNRIKEEIDGRYKELTNEVETLNAQKASLEEAINATTEKRLSLDTLLSEDVARSKKIEQLLTASSNHSEAINNFSKRVARRESQLEDQEATTEQYKEQLGAFGTDHENYLSDAKELIDSARLALEYKTAEGLSAAFTEQYNKANNYWPKFGWLLMASLFLSAAIGAGVWLTIEKNLTTEIIIGRISLLPILIAAAWFSAGQYVKQKNIAEDYAYKAVLTKSIVGFLEQFSTENDRDEDRSYFVKSILAQIHNDPLRKHMRKTSKDTKATDAEELTANM